MFLSLTFSLSIYLSPLSLFSLSVFLIHTLLLLSLTAGYLTFKESTSSYIFDNFNSDSSYIFKILIASHMLFLVPYAFIVIRQNVSSLLGIPLRLPNVEHCVLCTVILIVILVVSLSASYSGYSSGDIYISSITFLGFFITPARDFVFPSLIHLRIHGTSHKNYYKCLILLVFSVFLIVEAPVVYYMM